MLYEVITQGFVVLHGIVDSLWICRKNSTLADYEHLRDTIAAKTGFELSLDTYKWIVFLPSKNNRNNFV